MAEHDQIRDPAIGKVKADRHADRIAEMRKRVAAALGDTHGDGNLVALQMDGAGIFSGVLVGPEETAEHPSVGMKGAVTLEVTQNSADFLDQLLCVIVLAGVHNDQ